jgi:hypothetical protein
MGMRGRIKDLGFGMGGDLIVTLSLPRHHADSLKKLMDVDIEADIKKYREKRSMSQNAYAWVLITKIAQCINPPMNKEEVYAEMLKRYGQGGIISVQKDKASDVMRAFDYYVQKGEGEVNGKQFLHMMVYVGSSQYDTKEMSTFISGIVEEAKDLGIETLTPDEIARLRNG